MYTLTLTHGERKAIDWIGHRYRHGDDLCELLLNECDTGEEWFWEGDDDITFTIPEHVAWKIKEIIEEGLDCFSDEFKLKLYSFAEKVV